MSQKITNMIKYYRQSIADGKMKEVDFKGFLKINQVTEFEYNSGSVNKELVAHLFRLKFSGDEKKASRSI